MDGQKTDGSNDGRSYYGGSTDRAGDYEYHHDEEGEEGDDGSLPWSRRRHLRNRRAKAKSRRQAQRPPPPFDLSVVGVRCVLHRNDEVATYLDSGGHLIDYFGGADAQASSSSSLYGSGAEPATGWSPESEELGGFDSTATVSVAPLAHVEHRPLLIDRFDGRARLMDDYESFRGDGVEDEPTTDGYYCSNEDHGLASPDSDEVADEDVSEELNLERYGLLPEYEEVFRGARSGAAGASTTAHGSDEDDRRGSPGSGAVLDSMRQINEDGKKTSTAAEGQGGAAKSDDEVTPFEPTCEERGLLPSGIKLPTTRRQNDIIVMTAEKSASSEQFEVLLKLKQGTNNLFAFLRPGDMLHPYYLHLKRQAGVAVEGGEGGGGGGCSAAEVPSSQSGQLSSLQKTTGDNDRAVDLRVGLVDYASSSADDDEYEDDQRCSSNGVSAADDARGGTMSLVACYSSSGDEGDDVSGKAAYIKGDSKVIITHEPSDQDITEKCESGTAALSGSSPTNGSPGSRSATPVLASTNVAQPSVMDAETSFAHHSSHDDAPVQALPDEVKAKRLKRARLMKGHFALKMLERK